MFFNVVTPRFNYCYTTLMESTIWELMAQYKFWVLQRVLQHQFLHNHGFYDVGLTVRARILYEISGLPQHLHRCESQKKVVVMLGYSTCSYEQLGGPSIWTAKVRDGRVPEWRVYEDAASNRQRLGIIP